MTVERLREIEARAFAGSNAPMNNEALLRSMCFELIAEVRERWREVANLNGALGTDRRTIDRLNKENHSLKVLLHQAHGAVCGILINLESGKCAICSVFAPKEEIS